VINKKKAAKKMERLEACFLSATCFVYYSTPKMDVVHPSETSVTYRSNGIIAENAILQHL
jgi:hypothetical protein